MAMGGKEIYDNFQEGRGTTPLQQIAAELVKLQKTYGQRAESIKGIQDAMESAWSGDAGAKARQGAGPLSAALLDSATNMDSTFNSTMHQASSWHVAANSVEPVPPVPEKPNPWTTGLKAAIPVAGPFMASNDLQSYQDAVDAHNRAVVNNITVMGSYENQTSSNSGFPRSYGVLQPGSASISVETSTPNAISGDLSTQPQTTRSSTFVGPTSTATPAIGSVTGAVPNVSSPGYSGAVPANAVTPSVPVAGGPPAVGTTPPAAPTGIAAATNVPPSGTGSTSTTRQTNSPGRTAFGGTTRTPGTSTGSGTSRGSTLGERAGSRLYGTGGSGGSGGSGGAGAGRGVAAGGIGAGGGTASEGAARALAAGKGTGTGLPGGAAAAAAESAAKNTTAGARGAGMGGIGPAGAGRAKGDEDQEHQRAAYLQENDPDEVFIGDLGKTAPPVIGE
ncbi:hypothetical protein ABZ863_06565 [Saccharomonospora sp. NPDC046836]|uniref:hypothetical protein n=1 Tax=Saccharomonospora sp. NPDC046836 TaxID=3156921 RepID=UPI0033EEF79D